MKRKLLFAVSVILMVAGIAAITVALLAQKNGETGTEIQFFLKAVGILGMIGSIVCIYFYFGKVVESDEELEREEKDERNEMIRGKAAQNTMLLMNLSLLFIALLFICLEYFVPALLVGIVMCAGAQVNVLMIAHYQKKY